ncbi:MAG: sulfite exporter TauE/SafE [Alloalcanivorax sp.]
MNVIEFLLPQLTAAALLALAGAAHCVGMCGGIGTALTFTVPAGRRTGARLWGWQLLFGLGRISAYAVLGAVAGGLGNGLVRALPWHGPAWPALFSAAFMLLLALHFLTGGGLLRRLERPGAAVWRRLQPLARRLLPVDSPAKALMLGALWGFLPCGLVYSALLLAASSASVLGGLLVMTVFGALTLAPVAAGGVLGGQMRRFQGVRGRRLAAALGLLLGALFLAQGLAPGSLHRWAVFCGLA